MAQNWNMPDGSTRANVAIKTQLVEALEALRTLHSGNTEPPNTVANMLWMDTSTTPAVLKLRDTGNASWIELMSVGGPNAAQLHAQGFTEALAATETKYAGIAPRAGTIKRLVMVSSAATTSSSGNEWQPQVTVYPNTDPASPVTCFSATVGTFTTLVDVGGGVELVVDKALSFVPDQNAVVADQDVVEITMTKVGAPGNLADFRAYVEIA